MLKGGVPSYFIYNRRTYFVFFHEAGRASSIRPLPLLHWIGLGDDIVYRIKYLKRALTPPRSHMQQSIVLTDLAAGCVSITQHISLCALIRSASRGRKAWLYTLQVLNGPSGNLD